MPQTRLLVRYQTIDYKPSRRLEIQYFKIWTFWRLDFKWSIFKGLCCRYCYDPDHSKFWSLCPDFKRFFDRTAATNLDFKGWAPGFHISFKSEPFANQPLFNHSKSRPTRWISDPHCTRLVLMIESPLIRFLLYSASIRSLYHSEGKNYKFHFFCSVSMP